MWRGKLALGGASLGPGHEGPHKLEPGQAEGAPTHPQVSPKEAAGVALVQAGRSAGPRNVCYAGAGGRANPCVPRGAKPGTGLPLWAATSISTIYY